MMKDSLGLGGVVVVALSVWCAFVGIGDAFALPAGRHYEMVSPVYKGGFGATRVEGVAPDGESVIYFSSGAFNGAPSSGEITDNYFASRSPSGWSTTPLTVPTALSPELGTKDFSPTLGLVLAVGSPGPNSENQRLEISDLFLHSTELPDTVANWETIDELKAVHNEDVGFEYRGSSPDFCHILLSTSSAILSPQAEGSFQQLFEFDRGCEGEPISLRLVGVTNEIEAKVINSGCPVEAGIESDGGTTVAPSGDSFNAISADGRNVFFTDCLNGEQGPQSPHQLFGRVGGSRTLEISRPLEGGKFGGCVSEVGSVPGEVPCAGAMTRPSADFAGASESGSKVYFTTTGQLSATDQDSGQDLYMATIGCAESRGECKADEAEVTSMTQVSHDPNGYAAEVQGVVRVAPDGQRVYFVAGGDLLTSAQKQGLEGEGRPVPRVGAANLYVYDSAGGGSTAFVGDLCSGKELSGTTEDIRCPSAEADTKLWSGAHTENAGESQTAGSDGDFLVFATYGQLTKGDTNAAKDVYRYDATTGTLARVSGGEDGFDPNGDEGLLGASIAQGHLGGTASLQYEMNNRAVSEDGSRIVFTSAEPLSPADSNGLVNAYEWHEGEVSLVSTGNDQEPVGDVLISANGRSVFFKTVQGLVPQDGDGAVDIYDARLEAGFSEPPTESRPCEGDACQGPLTNPAPLLVPGSLSQVPEASKPSATAKTLVKAKSKSRAKCKTGFKRHERNKRRKCVKQKKVRKPSIGAHRGIKSSREGAS